VAYLQVSPLGGSRDETWHGQRIRKRSLSWNLPKLSHLWRCNRGFGPHATQNHLRTKQFMSGTWNSSRVATTGLFVSQRTLNSNFMYYSRIVLSVGGSVWYVVWNLCCTVTIDSVLSNSKTQNAFFFPVHAMFCHDCPVVVKPASMPRRLGHKKNLQILYLLTCSPSTWPSLLLYRRGQKSWNDLRITLYKM
jgi:hypothetical protein